MPTALLGLLNAPAADSDTLVESHAWIVALASGTPACVWGTPTRIKAVIDACALLLSCLTPKAGWRGVSVLPEELREGDAGFLFWGEPREGDAGCLFWGDAGALRGELRGGGAVAAG